PCPNPRRRRPAARRLPVGAVANACCELTQVSTIRSRGHYFTAIKRRMPRGENKINVLTNTRRANCDLNHIAKIILKKLYNTAAFPYMFIPIVFGISIRKTHVIYNLLFCM
ncbi:hypothetical protein, partial [Serratia rubidaea]|uniref:hypothetical protein n=1 Tax=Serratia rubidaea TaxID=61652 RepID=UPI001BAEAF4E